MGHINDCFTQIMVNSVDPYVKKLEQCSEMIGRLENVVDKGLDKPMDANRPKYVAGDCMNDIRCIVDDTKMQLEYVRRIVRAYSAAWDYWGDATEEAHDARRHYVRGFMDATYED